MLSSPKALATSLSAPALLINYAVDLQRSISYISLSTACVLFLAGLITLAVLQFVLRKRKPLLITKETPSLDRHITNLTIATLLMLWGSTAVSLAAAYSTRSALSALQVATSPEYGTAIGGKIVRGISLEVMQWTAFAVSLLFSSCVHVTARASGSNSSTREKPSLSPVKPEIIKIMTPPGQRLALIAAQSPSQHSITESLQLSPVRSDTIKQMPPLDQHPPTLQRRPTQKGTTEEKPLMQFTPAGNHPSRTNSQKSTRKGTTQEKSELSPVTPSALKPTTPTTPTTPFGIHGLRPPPSASPRPTQKNTWV
jgi:hypothetical protein